MPRSCRWYDMKAAFMSYDEMAGPGSAVTGMGRRLCGTTGTAARYAHRFTIND
jgi:hypothetical protein